MNATAITQAASAIAKAERRHEYAITALMHARNAGRPTRHLEAELRGALSEYVRAYNTAIAVQIDALRERDARRDGAQS